VAIFSFLSIRAASRPILCLFLGLLAVSSSDAQAQAVGTQCTTRECFAEHVASCEAATFDTPVVAGARARYTVHGPPGEDECEIGFEFLDNPNRAWVGLPLFFVVDTEQAFEPQLKEAMAECLQGKSGSYRCAGPLWELVGGGDQLDQLAGGDQLDQLAGGDQLDQLAGGHDMVELRMAADPTCGVAVDDEGPPLYPLPHDGRWGYVTRDGEWAIEPRWIQAEPFSEGRAAVDGGAELGGLWGVIDRAGNYVLEPVLRPDLCSDSGDRLCKSPIRPFSEGCASAQHFDEHSRYLFLTRDGSTWLFDTLPEGVPERSFGGFGDFSEGKAWFHAWERGPETNYYGWIDASGQVVIPRQYSGAGNFVDGFAPAAIRSDLWALMDTDGNPAIPTKWKYYGARSFSEGLAAIKIDVSRWMYFSDRALVIDKIEFKTPGQIELGPPGEAGLIGEAGSFHDGLAPVRPKWASDDEFLFIRPDGSEAFSPARDLHLKVCTVNPLPEFQRGLVRLLVANDGETCGETGADFERRAEYDKAHFVYLDTSGKIVLEQAWREGDADGTQ